MSNLAEAQMWADEEKLVFTKDELRRIHGLKIPGEERRKWGASLYPRRPVEDPGEWLATWRAKLAGLERAAKY